MQVNAHLRGLLKFSEMDADGQRLVFKGDTWCFDSQPVDFVTRAVESKPHDCRDRKEQGELQTEAQFFGKVQVPAASINQKALQACFRRFQLLWPIQLYQPVSRAHR